MRELKQNKIEASIEKWMKMMNKTGKPNNLEEKWYKSIHTDIYPKQTNKHTYTSMRIKNKDSGARQKKQIVILNKIKNY